MQFPIYFVSSGFRFAQDAVPDFAPTKVRGKLSSSGFRFAQDTVVRESLLRARVPLGKGDQGELKGTLSFFSKSLTLRLFAIRFPWPHSRQAKLQYLYVLMRNP